MHALVKFYKYIPYSLRVRGNNSKTKNEELSSLFMTYRLIVMYAPVKFHEYIPYSLGVMARIRLTI